MENKTNKILIISLLALAFFVSISVNKTFAQQTERGTPIGQVTVKPEEKKAPPTKLDNPINANNVKELLLSMVDLAIFLGSIIAIFVFIWVGFTFVMAQGKEAEITKAKDWFLYAVIGTAMLISSKIIVSVLQNTLISAGVVDQKIFNQKQ